MRITHQPSPSRRDVVFGIAAGAMVAGNVESSPANAQATPEVLRITDQLVDAAKKEGELTLRHGAIDSEAESIAESFKRQFGISVGLDRKVGVIATQQFVTEERNNRHIMDVAYSTDGAGVYTMARDGLLLPYTIPDVDKLLPSGKIIEAYGYAPKWVKVIISYNPSLLPHAKAKSLLKTWRGLLDPSLANGQIGLLTPSPAQIPFAVYLMLLRMPEYGREFLQKLAAQKPKFYKASAQARDDLAAGAIAVMGPNWDDVARSLIMSGEKTAWVNPEIIPNAGNIYLSISKKAPHPAAARLFVAWLLSMDGAKAFERAEVLSTLTNYTDERRSTLELKKTEWFEPFSDATKLWDFNIREVDANYSKLVEELNQLLGSP